MSDPDLWSQLLSSALVGTQRRRCVVPPLDGPLATLVPPGELDPAGLLLAAATVTVARRAGAAPVEATPSVPAPAETASPAPAGAAAALGHLIDALASEPARAVALRAFIREWLQLAARRQLLAPASRLPALADLVLGDDSLAPLVRSAGGARLTWLAWQRADRWGWVLRAAHQPTEADWHQGTLTFRARYLEQLRERDPAAGRELLAEVWAGERAADLAVLIGACATGLGPDDESWLERALDDRRAQIREAAATLLSELPGSGYRARMTVRALACVQADGDRRLTVRPPVDYDAGMRRDGLFEKAPGGQGQRGWWLEQIVSRAPLEAWAAIDAEPARLLARTANDDWVGTLRRGWARATAGRRDRGPVTAAWAAALVHSGALGQRGEVARDVVAQLRADDIEDIAVLALGRKEVREQLHSLSELLAAAPRPWSPRLAAAVLRHMLTSDRQRSSILDIMRLAEISLDPGMLPQVRDLLASAGEQPYRHLLEEIASTLRTRSAIHREFA
jgi:hypothetical protein